MKNSALLLNLLLATASLRRQQAASAQPQATAVLDGQVSSAPLSSLPNAPQPNPTPPARRAEPMQAYEGIVLGSFCGMGASTSSVATKPTLGCGFGGDLLLIPVFFEFGILTPQANRSDLTGYLSIDANIPLRRTSSRYLPVAIGGYSRLFETGHALDYGVALAVPRGSSNGEARSLQIELRDYWTFANPNQHNVLVRVGWLIGASD